MAGSVRPAGPARRTARSFWSSPCRRPSVRIGAIADPVVATNRSPGLPVPGRAAWSVRLAMFFGEAPPGLERRRPGAAGVVRAAGSGPLPLPTRPTLRQAAARKTRDRQRRPCLAMRQTPRRAWPYRGLALGLALGLASGVGASGAFRESRRCRSGEPLFLDVIHRVCGRARRAPRGPRSDGP